MFFSTGFCQLALPNSWWRFEAIRAIRVYLRLLILWGPWFAVKGGSYMVLAQHKEGVNYYYYIDAQYYQYYIRINCYCNPGSWRYEFTNDQNNWPWNTMNPMFHSSIAAGASCDDWPHRNNTSRFSWIGSKSCSCGISTWSSSSSRSCSTATSWFNRTAAFLQNSQLSCRFNQKKHIYNYRERTRDAKRSNSMQKVW